ncbi:hypothetical protein [Luteimonas sp. gir]|uniref:hypothetical protein n=1 Tax=Luteimonas sp. gir TaxID=3127960 RepID=UPI003075E933
MVLFCASIAFTAYAVLFGLAFARFQSVGRRMSAGMFVLYMGAIALMFPSVSLLIHVLFSEIFGEGVVVSFGYKPLVLLPFLLFLLYRHRLRLDREAQPTAAAAAGAVRGKNYSAVTPEHFDMHDEAATGSAGDGVR